jgi:ATP-dependent DNA helicase RecG
MVHPDRVVDEARLFEAAADRSGLSAHRRAAPEPGAQGARSTRSNALPAFAGMAGCGLVQAQWLSGFAAALRRVHRPADPTDLEPQSAAWSRLAYDELLAGQLALALLRAHLRARPGRGSAAEGPACAPASSPRCPIR